MNTIITNRYPVSSGEYNKFHEKKIENVVADFEDKISVLLKELQSLVNEKITIYLCGRDAYFDCKLNTIYPNFLKFDKVVISKFSEATLENSIQQVLKEKNVLNNIQSEIPTITQLKAHASTIKQVYDENAYFVCIYNDVANTAYYNYYNKYVYYNVYKNEVKKISGKDCKAYIIPIVNLRYTYNRELVMKYLLPGGAFPNRLSPDSDEVYSDLFQLYSIDPSVMESVPDKIKIHIGKLIDLYRSGSYRKVFDSMHWSIGTILDANGSDFYTQNDGVAVHNELLNCEKVRADIDPYEEKILTDPNRGHWDLWQDENVQFPYSIELKEKLVARNPVCDINENGVIAIDFGTKSTIVVYQSDIEHSLPMGIGDGNLRKEPSAKRYENPTIMHFVDLETFLKDYKAMPGRPKTTWQDLTISHTAQDQFSNSKSDEYYEYMNQIKQWAGQREKQFRIQSHTGETYVLPAFLDLTDEDWNPIEIYAYYIGLYINNMRKGHGIYLDYYLSFPVTYETKIREKIIKSFEKGLKKSLPTCILQNEELMRNFHVNGDISEPAAYAVCALQEYGFDPEDDEEVFYGIFDFGGGTTDFDFGIWKQSSKRRYDYTIENFGAGGDEYLGGENLLEMLAFEVFKENQNLMREKEFTFTLAPKCVEFHGSDALLAESQEAEKNMHNLMEKLRPYWETEAYSQDDSENTWDIQKMIDAIRKCSAKYSDDGVIEQRLDNIENCWKKESADEDKVRNYLTEIIDQYEIRGDDLENDEIKFVVTLFDKNGDDHVNETLYFSYERLQNIIENRIREGVENFFYALMLSYQYDRGKKSLTVNILLAGNSCKSPVVKKVFEEKVAEEEAQIRETCHVSGDMGKVFEIFPPLGTEAAYKKMEERGLEVQRDDFEKPTGKTGVAFGLIQCRAGGVIERITNSGIKDEIPFQYFIGWRSKKKFQVFKDDSKITKYKGKPDYNIWYKFIEADDSVFDLYYTTLPECITGILLVDGNAAVKRLRCTIDAVDENAFVYIRAVDPHTLEYVVAKTDDVEQSMMGQIVRKEL